MSSTIPQALSALSQPVSYAPYKGSAPSYVAYQLVSQDGQIYAEGREAETAVLYAVTCVSPGFAPTFFLDVKSKLEAAGYIVTVDASLYDHDSDTQQVTLLAEIAGAVYG